MSVWEDEHKGGQRLDVYIKVGGGTRGRATDVQGQRRPEAGVLVNEVNCVVCRDYEKTFGTVARGGDWVR